MKQLLLTTGETALVNDDVYRWAKKFTWWAAIRGKRKYVVRHGVNSKGDWTKIYLHREILELVRGEYGDHKNGDGLNNLRRNLRKCSNQQNASAFRNPMPGKTSRFRGVSFDSERGLWVAQIRKSFSKIFLGRFTQEEDAARAYDAAAKRLFGKFAQPNFK